MVVCSARLVAHQLGGDPGHQFVEILAAETQFVDAIVPHRRVPHQQFVRRIPALGVEEFRIDGGPPPRVVIGVVMDGKRLGAGFDQRVDDAPAQRRFVAHDDVLGGFHARLVLEEPFA